MGVLHSIILTQQELSDLSGFFIMKDDGQYKENDYIVATIKEDDVTEKNTKGEDVTNPGRITRQQVFFNVNAVNTAATTKGIRRGYAMLKVKRTKNPIPKQSVPVVDEPTPETDEQA